MYNFNKQIVAICLLRLLTSQKPQHPNDTKNCINLRNSERAAFWNLICQKQDNAGAKYIKQKTRRKTSIDRRLIITEKAQNGNIAMEEANR